MALGPIPGASIRSFAREHGIAGDWFDSFLSLIRALDGEYLRLMAPKDPKQGNVVRGDDIEGVKALLSRAAKQPGG